MKLLILSRSTTHHITSGGMETHLKNLVEGLAERGSEVDVLTTAHPEHLDKNFEVKDGGVIYHFIGDTTPGLNPLYAWEKIFYKLGFLNRGPIAEGTLNFFEESNKIFKSLSANRKFDAVISQSTGAYGIYEDLSIPLISIIHGTIKTEIKNRWQSLKSFKNYVRFLGVDLFKWAYEFAIENKKFFEKNAKIIAVSSQLKKDFAQDFPEFENKIIVIPNGVDEKKFKPAEQNDKYEKFTLLNVGRMELEKGIDILINAVAEIKEKDFEILLIGDGVHMEYFKELATGLGLNEKIKFLGKISNQDLADYYRKSHVFVLPSRRVEGHPMTISEAMCSGLPILSTRSGGLKELFEDGKEGFFIEDKESLAEKIKLLMNDKKLLAELSSNSYKKAIQSYSKNAMISKYISCLNSL